MILLVLVLATCTLDRYRAEDSKAVARETAGCEVTFHHHTGWTLHTLSLGFMAEDVNYPMTGMVFVACDETGKPYAFELLRSSGAPPLKAVDCGASAATQSGCRVEITFPTRQTSHHFVVRMTRHKGDQPVDISVKVLVERHWRSRFWAAAMGV